MPMPISTWLCCLLSGSRFREAVSGIVSDLVGGQPKQMWIPANAVRAAGVQAATAALNGQGFFVYSFADNQDRNVQFNMQIPRDMDRSLPATLCFGWSSPAVTLNLVADVTYLITAAGEDTEAAPTTHTGNIYASAGVADGLVMSGLPVIPAGAIGADDACIHVSLERDGDNVLDTLADIMELHGVALRYTSNAFGV